MAKKLNPKTAEEKRQEMQDIIHMMHENIEKVTQSPEDIKEYLSFMSQFYSYSLNNTMMIHSQFRGATAVASFLDYKRKGFSVNKGEKGIAILVPIQLPQMFIDLNGNQKKVSEATKQEKEMIQSGRLKVQVGKKIGFKKGDVFDISQTNAKASDLPELFPNKWLEGDVDKYSLFLEGMKQVAANNGIQVVNPKRELGAAKGVSYTLLKEVALNPRNSEKQNVKTLLHELTHAKLHTADTSKNFTKAEKEFQAELVAVSVCSYFGIDTTEYSLPYLYSWTKGVKLNDKQALLEGVRQTAMEMVNTIEPVLLKEEELKNKEDKAIPIFIPEKQSEKVEVKKVKEFSHSR